MKKVLAIILTLTMALCMLSGCGETPSGGNTTDDKTIKIGIFEPASGDNAAGGKQEVLGMRYAHSLKPTVNINGEEYKVELFEVDNQTTAEKAPAAASTLVSEKVSVVLGTYGSGAAMAGGEIFAAANIPAIGCSCTNPGVTSNNEYYFRICYIDPFQGTVMANHAKDAGAKTAYVLTQLGDDYSTGLGTYFKKAFEALGGKVIAEEFPEGTTNFASYIAKATAEGADVMFAPTSTAMASLIIAQCSTANVTYKLMAGDTWESSVILDASKGTNLDISVSTFFDEADPSAAEFVKGYKAWLNGDPQNLTNNGGNDIVAAVSALGFDTYNVALAAIEKANSTDSVKIKEALASMTVASDAVNGVTGSIYFDSIGDAVRDTAYIKGVDTATGAFKFLKVQTISNN